MRVVIQRVSEASVSIQNTTHAKIGKGLLLLLGIHQEDKTDDVDWLVQKIQHMRIFEDDQQKMNISIQDIQGEILIISQFTLYGSTKKGNRPSFISAAAPDQAIPLYNYFIQQLRALHVGKVETGVFGAHMHVQLINDGPVTIIIDSKQKE